MFIAYASSQAILDRTLTTTRESLHFAVVHALSPVLSTWACVSHKASETFQR